MLGAGQRTYRVSCVVQKTTRSAVKRGQQGKRVVDTCFRGGGMTVNTMVMRGLFELTFGQT